jgi:hypothetical protein
MPTLREFQQCFAAALFDDACEPLSAQVRDDGGDCSARIGIYRSQLRAGFARTLALEFPVIARLVGGEYFQRLGCEFQAVQPSRSGNLHHIGAPFSTFLKQRFCGGPYDYLADVAQLEWALQESTVAPAAPAFDLHALGSVDPADYAALRFTLHPTCRLVSSQYPVLDIWRANQSAAPPATLIDLGSGAARVLLQRRAHVIEFHGLSPPEFALLETLARDFFLGAALESAQQHDRAFDLGAALRRFVALNALTGATLLESSVGAFARA